MALRLLLALFLTVATTALPARAQNGGIQEVARLIEIAERYQKQEQHREAARFYGQARAVAAQVFGNDSHVAALTQAEALMIRQLGDFAQAEKLLEETLRISEAARDREMIAESANNLAAVRWDNGKYLGSLAMHEKANEMFRQIHGEGSSQLAVSRNNLAGVYKSLGQEDKAEPLYQQAIAVLERHQPKEAHALADALMNFADLFTTRGELTRAELLLLRSVDIKERAFGPNHYEVARTLNNLASLYTTMGQYDKSEERHRRALGILERSLGRDHLDVARSLVNLAGVHQRREQYDRAEPLFRRAVEIREARLEPDHPDVAVSKQALAGLCVEMGRHDEALALYDEALAAREGRFGKDHPLVAYTLMAQAHVAHLTGRYDDSRDLYHRALEIRTTKLPPDHPDLAYTHNGLAGLAGATEDWHKAAEHFDYARRGFRGYVGQVLPALSEADQLTFLREVDEDNFQSALSLIAKAPDDPVVTDLTAGWVLNGKGVAQQALAQRALLARDTTDPLLAAVAKSLLAVRKQLASLSLVESETEDAARRRQRLDELAKQEREQAATLARLGGRPVSGEWVELDSVRNAIPKGAVLVEIARFRVYDYRNLKTPQEELPEHYFAWVFPAHEAGDIKAVDLGTAAEVDEAVRAARKAIGEAPGLLRELGEEEAEGAIKESFSALSAKVLEPILARAGDATRLYVSPDSLLWLVPWNALPLGDGAYAIEKYDFRFLVSGRDRIAGDRPANTGRPIMFANPNYDLKPAEVQETTARLFRTAAPPRGPVRAATGTLSIGAADRLPGTKAEADAVRPQLEQWAGGQATLYDDRWALEAVFKSLRKPRAIVLSTHGFFKSETGRQAAATIGNPLLQCGLLLAGCNHPVDATGDAEDGILTGLEIVGADLRGTELVVLSACETGLGEVRTGEGVAGLRQAFQLAGARAVVSTLWQIPDRETAKLMSTFFATLAERDDKAAALRAAQLDLIESRRDRKGGAHPFFWAAFTITGE